MRARISKSFVCQKRGTHSISKDRWGGDGTSLLNYQNRKKKTKVLVGKRPREGIG